jgi:hypothetical protein
MDVEMIVVVLLLFEVDVGLLMSCWMMSSDI